MQVLYQLSYSPMGRADRPQAFTVPRRHASVQETSATPSRHNRPPAGCGRRQTSSPSSAPSTVSASAPTLNSSSRQRPPSTRRDTRDQQQLPMPPVTLSSRPSSRDIPQVSEAPWPTTTTREPGSDWSAILVRAAAVRSATYSDVSPPGGCQAARSSG